MDDLKAQIVNTIAAQNQPQIKDFFQQLSDQAHWIYVDVLILSAISVIVMLTGLFFRWRMNAAVMRIDKNLQRLVDTQIPAKVEKKNHSKKK